jgi:tRNA dimethylallyltransferase
MHARHAWFLIGPTAAGKTAVAHRLALRGGTAVLSADAMLVYRGMDVGTAKPTAAERREVRYFGIDLADPDRPFSAGAWLERVRAELADGPWGRAPADPLAPDALLVAGGTGLYVRALTAGLDAAPADPARRRHWQARLAAEGLPALAAELARRAPDFRLADAQNPRRVIRALEQLDAGKAPAAAGLSARPAAVGLRLARPALHARILARVRRMFDDGLLDEVAALRQRYPAWGHSHASKRAGEAASPGSDGGCTARQAIGYAEACAVLDGHLTVEMAAERIAARTRQLAKRQETWFRHQTDAAWIDVGPDEPADAVAERVLAAWREHGPTPIRVA